MDNQVKFTRTAVSFAIVCFITLMAAGCASTGGGSGSAPSSGNNSSGTTNPPSSGNNSSGTTNPPSSGTTNPPSSGTTTPPSSGGTDTGTGGSGSSGSSGGGTTTPTNAVTKTTLVAAAPTTKETTARGVQTWLNKVSKPYANQLGTGNGAGVTVGVVDSGAQVNHPELNGQILATYNAFDEGTVITDQIGHGTHVSGIIAGTLANGAPFEGVAPGAKLVEAKVFNSTTSDTVTIAKGLDWVVNVKSAPIVNLSLGFGVVAMQSSIQNAVDKGTLLVAALGNDGLTGAASWPAEYAKESWANGQIIAVGAVDSNNVRASFSNMDATLANWTVYAPGVNVASSYSVPGQPNAYSFMSGTSMATPVVSGQAALLKSNWNFLSAQTIAQIIFKTATRVCSDGSSAVVCAAKTTADSVYGWGVVNISASLQPVGSLNVSTSAGQAVTYSGTTLATSKSGLASGLTGTNVTAVDSFNRGFVVNLGATAASASITTQSIPTVPSAASESAGFAARAQLAAGQGAEQAGAVGKYSMSFSSNNGNSYALGYGAVESTYFGLDAKGGIPLALGGNESKFSTPYFKLMDSATQLGYGFKLSESSAIRFGGMSQGATEVSKAKSLATVELDKKFGETTTVLSLGRLNESESLLGFSGQGALALGGESRTNFVTFAASKPVFANFSVSGMLSVGHTEAFKNSANSLISGTSESYSGAWSLGLARNDLFKDGDKLGFTVSMPMRTMTGSMYVQGAISQNQSDGSLNYATQEIALAPKGRQQDIELSYSRPVSKTANVTALAQMKLEPGHVANAPTQYGVGLKFTNSF